MQPARSARKAQQKDKRRAKKGRKKENRAKARAASDAKTEQGAKEDEDEDEDEDEAQSSEDDEQAALLRLAAQKRAVGASMLCSCESLSGVAADERRAAKGTEVE